MKKKNACKIIIFFLVHAHVNKSMVFSCKTEKCWKTELSLWQPPPRKEEFPFQLEKGKASDNCDRSCEDTKGVDFVLRPENEFLS